MVISLHVLGSLSAITQKSIAIGGYPSLALFILLGSLNIPLPSEVAYGFSGFLSSRGILTLPLVIIVGALANIVGASFNYWFGASRKKNHHSNSRFLFASADKLSRGETWFSRWGEWGVFLGYFIPGIRAIISFPAGFFGIGFRKFVTATLFASFMWATFWSFLGFKLGVEWEKISVYTSKFDVVIAVALVLAVAWWLKNHFSSKHT